MGGYGSGRRPEKYDGTVEECHSLDINKMIRGKWIEPGRRTSGIIQWKAFRRVVASIKHDAHLDKLSPYIRLCSYNPIPVDFKVALTTTYPNYGGGSVLVYVPILWEASRQTVFGMGAKIFYLPDMPESHL